MLTAEVPKRFIGLDIHKNYFVAIGVDAKQKQVLGPQEAPMRHLERWAEKNLTPQDAVVVEMTTNTYVVYDTLKPLVHSVTVVHPPHVALIVRAQVKTDKKAALTLAQLHAAGLLPGIWIPPVEVRELRALIAQRRKLVKLASIAKCRLHSLLHRHDIELPEGFEPFSEDMRAWWEHLKVSPLERQLMLSDRATLDFAKGQLHEIEETLKELAARDERVPLLVQVTGIGLLTAITILAAIGDITRFPSAKHLVGYAGLGARVHASGESFSTGRISKTGRKDLRWVMVDAANHAVQDHPHWKQELARLEPRLGRSRAVVRVARQLLMAVWHILSKEAADKHNDARSVAASLFLYAYRVKVRNLGGMSAKGWTRHQLDRLGIGRELSEIPWGTKRVKLPPSELPPNH